MTEEPKGIALKDLDEVIYMQEGTAVSTVSGGKNVELTRKLAVVHALGNYADAVKDDKFKAYDLGMRFTSANGEVSVDADESVMIKLAVEIQWPKPGIYVPLCRWLEGA